MGLAFYRSGATIIVTDQIHTGIILEVPMFDSLADRIKQDERVDGQYARYLRWALVAVISSTLFGGLYLVVQKLE